MKKIILLSTVLWSFALIVQAQLLWKISGNGLKSPSYIFGTHHVAPLHICDSIKGFEQAFVGCEQLYGEVEMEGMMNMDAQTQMEISKYMMLPQDSLLNTLYTPEEYALIDAALKKILGVGAEQVKMLKPSSISAQMSVVQSMNAFKDFNPQNQLDHLLQKKAKEKGIPVLGLETVAFQMEVLFGEPISEQAEDLLRAINHEKLFMKYAKEMAESYMKQDIEALLTSMSDPKVGCTEKQMERLVNKRNRNWIVQLKELLPQKSTFIVVGAGHLPGKEGLINLLRKSGYTVDPVE